MSEQPESPPSGPADVPDSRNSSDIEQSLREELRAVERRAAFLSEASSVLAASSLNVEATIHVLSRLATSRLADWCMVYTTDRMGRVRYAAVAHRDPRREPLLRSFNGASAAPEVLESIVESGEMRTLDALPPELIREIEAAGCSDAIDPADVSSVLVAPLLGRGRALGALLLVSTGAGYTSDDMQLVEELVRRAAIAIDNARLFHDAQQANRTKLDFLAVMSHELRTPLNAIMGYTDLLDAEIDGPLHPRQRGQLSRIRASARQLLQLIEEVLGFARLEAGTEDVHLQRLSFGALVRDATAVAEPFAQNRQLRFDVDIRNEEERIETDPDKTRQILVNLLSNAIKFTSSGSVTLRARLQGEYAVFDVCDTGIGIDADQIEAIFDPFWQAERPNTRRVGGTGLGLSVSRRYARLLGGEIEVASTPGEGSCFTLTLPLRFDPNGDTARPAGIADADAEKRFAAMRSGQPTHGAGDRKRD